MSNARYISNLTRDTYALILAGGRGSRLHELTDWRAKPALYFGGKFRIIDFPLSNCINSGIRRVGVVTQYKSHSLIRHVSRGWGHFKKELGESVEILPASQQTSGNWYEGTADAVFQNIDIIRHELPKYVMVLSGDHVYRMDYAGLLAAHAESGADMTVCCLETPIPEAANAFGVMEVDEDMRVVGFEEKPAVPKSIPGNEEFCLASMGNYVFNTKFLFDQLKKDANNENSDRDFGKDIIPSIIEHANIFAFPFTSAVPDEPAYWRDVGTLDSFFQANMELLSPTPALNLYDAKWPIWTYQEQLPPAKFVFDDDDRRGMAVDSIVSGGCIISGAKVKRSVLFDEVRVCSYSLVKDSVLLPDVVVLKNCRIQNAIIDRGCIIPEGMEIGFNRAQDIARGFRVSEKGITLVTRKMLGLPTGYE
ncbi:glucose-1-phosphate adenylyltransferase [Pseudomonadota bacterium]|uniref:glucose-1-phosphate adenylyltransferase n=1 Tax=unclassified Shewanella TaxID=196818 RepID=UPI000C839767|nr:MULTISPECIES: glucose-1-phosphate adenylyltransferase [unclassified Shewanella]MDO6620716.1 glucose-1-phosphate adenylyltransferase [Shewanella sp. 6_MG-2023]MDO6640471.1 glucose-1-phosphate adenylyltransferase [Shewanella sp. 5_MG-2023]PMG28552.1 glucose-1-phosphate adenylyltransferase [Shewanella sp. 10N.286.52.C2]PMH87099.1 glucose-1-phosphate adenylyltransferase [Shewanella sp. 10N.286.48.B5]